MKKNIRKWTALLIAALMVLMAVSPAALAAPDHTVSISWSADPASMHSAGTSLLSIRIENAGGGTMTNVRICEGAQVLQTTGDIPAGAAATAYIEYDVEASQLGQALPLTLEYNVDDGVYSKPINAVITKETASPTLSVSRSVSQTSVKPGQKVTITYELTNAGNTTLYSVQVIDGEVGFSKTLEFLMTGDHETFTHEFTAESNVRSAPVVTFTALGQNYSKNLDPQVISIVSPTVTITAQCDTEEPKVGDTIHIFGQIANTGNCALEQLSLRDAKLGEVFTAPSLDVGQSLSYDKELVYQEDMEVLLTLSATDALLGSAYTASAQPLQIKGGAADPVDLQVLVSASADEIEKAGTVTFKVKIINYGANPVEDVVISEPACGQLEKVDGTIMPNQSRTVELNLSVMETQTYTFEVSAKDAKSGVEGKASASPVTVKIEAAPQPEEGAPAEEEKSGIKGWVVGLIGVVALLGAAAGVVLIILRKNQDREDGQKVPSGKGKVERPVPDPTPEQPEMPTQEEFFAPDVTGAPDGYGEGSGSSGVTDFFADEPETFEEDDQPHHPDDGSY